MTFSDRCQNCRYWSEMLAQTYGGHVEAMCLSSNGPRAGSYTTGQASCVAWKSGHHGAVDCPPYYGEDARKAYAEEDVA